MKIGLEDVLALTGSGLLIGGIWYDYGHIKAGMVLGALFLIIAVMRIK